LDLSFKKEELPDLEHNNDDFEGNQQEFERDETKDEIPEIIKNNRRRKLSFGNEVKKEKCLIGGELDNKSFGWLIIYWRFDFKKFKTKLELAEPGLYCRFSDFG